MVDTSKPNTAPVLTKRDGWITTDFGVGVHVSQVAQQSDGKFLVAGGNGSLFALARYNPDGSLDTSFNDDGKLTTEMGSGLYDSAISLRPDGTIVALQPQYHDFNIAHFTSSGELDTSFGKNGILASAYRSDFPLIKNLYVDGDGRILTTGTIYVGQSNYFISRYNPDGQFDTSFGRGGGAVAVDIGPDDRFLHLLLQPDGKILFLGAAADRSGGVLSLAHLNADGTLDTSFGGDGTLTVGLSDPLRSWLIGTMALQSDGKIVVGLSTGTLQGYFGLALTRYNTDGSLDTSFQGTGPAALSGDGINRQSVDTISIQQDGKIVVFGIGLDSNHTHYVYVARFLPDGSVDRTFGEKGVTYAATPPESDAKHMLIQADGKIVVIGNTSSEMDLMMLRFNTDGSIDHAFSPSSSTSGGTAVFVENSVNSPHPAVVLDSAVQVSDTELAAIGSYGGASLTLARHEGANSDDVFSAKTGGTLSTLKSGSDFSVDGVTIGHVTANGAGILTLTFTSKATEALVNKALQQIAYANTSNSPPAKVLIDWSFSDGNTGTQGTGGTLTAVDSTAMTIIATNDAPVAHGIVAQKAVDGAAFSFVIPDSAFTDPDHDTLGYSVVMGDGKPLPSWLTFDAATLTLSGTPGTANIGLLTFRVTATDGNGAAAATYFALDVIPKPMHVDGTAGADNLVGAANDDVLQGFVGNDTLNGKAGADTMIGGDGNDSYYVDNAGDVVTESANGGTDTVYSTLKSYHLAPNVEYAQTLFLGNGDLIGNELNNVLYASAGNNVLDGGLGNDTASYAYATGAVSVSLAVTTAQNTIYSGSDTLLNIENLAGSRFNDNLTGNQDNNTLNGGAGADTMTGGDGSDIYIVDNAGDVVRETNADPVKGGIDTINASVTYKITGYAENLTLTGTDAINATGNSLANKLVGNSGSNVLDGGGGADVMSGGLGNDTYYVDNSSDVVAEIAGGGTDTVISTVTRTLGDYQENLTLAGTAAINGAGNSLDNTIIGNSARNVLNGGAGADKMSGGLGDDFYYVDNAGDTVTESSDATSGGTDTVISTITYTLGNYVENLTLSGSTAINGTGNALANKIIGNAAANTLSGGDGADTLSGGLGNDVLIGGQGKDVLEGGSGSDVFVLNAASETGTTSAAWDVINDFVRGQDKLDLRGIDANTATVTNDAFTAFVAGTAAFTAAGQLKFANGVLYGNTDADADAEFAIALTGITQLGTADVML
jgi:uncharacterized delta-60 repeat protein